MHTTAIEIVLIFIEQKKVIQCNPTITPVKTSQRICFAVSAFSDLKKKTKQHQGYKCNAGSEKSNFICVYADEASKNSCEPPDEHNKVQNELIFKIWANKKIPAQGTGIKSIF